MKPGDKVFILHWRDGSINTVQGPTVEEAFTTAGFGRGAVPALDYYEEVVEPKVVENILKEMEEKIKIKITIGKLFHIPGIGTPGFEEIVIEGEIKSDIGLEKTREIISEIQGLINSSANHKIKIEEII